LITDHDGELLMDELGGRNIWLGGNAAAQWRADEQMAGDQQGWGLISTAVLAAVRAQGKSWQSEGFTVEVSVPGRNEGEAISLWCTSSRSSAIGHLSVWSSGAADTLIGATGRGEPEMRSFTVGSVSDIGEVLAYFARTIRAYD
jgi:hypothetical protein